MTTRLRILSEAEAYARCYGGVGEDVKVVRVPRRPRYQLEVSGEDLRVAFAERLDRREPELAEGMEAGADGSSMSAFESPTPFESPAALDAPETPLEGPAEAVEPPAVASAHDEEAA